VPLAEIYPLVTARALARMFTYEVAEGVERGDIVSIRLGSRSVRGVVVKLGVESPAGVEISAAGGNGDRRNNGGFRNLVRSQRGKDGECD